MGLEEHLKLEATGSPTRWRCSFSPFVLTPRRNLQGGAGLAAALLALERVTGRPTVWATAQYLSFAAGTDPVEVELTLEVEGRQTTQARCILSRNGEEILTAHAALGERDFGPDRTWVDHPGVPAPKECPPFRFLKTGEGTLGDIMELRLARGRQIDDLGGVPGAANSAYWCRITYGRHPVSVGELAFIGDFLPIGFAEAYGVPHGVSSIDNTIRVGRRGESEWVLLDCRIEHVANGFGYGRAHLWSEDGVLLGTATQTMAMRNQPITGLSDGGPR